VREVRRADERKLARVAAVERVVLAVLVGAVILWFGLLVYLLVRG
jgi:hypothetical protein